MEELLLEPVAGTKNRVFVKRAETQEKITASGIIVETAANAAPHSHGVALGGSIQNENGVAPTVQKGDTVFFSPYANTEMEFEGLVFLTMKETDIFGRIKNS